MYTASAAFVEALVDAGVSYIFGNFGSDHPGLLEYLAKAKALGLPAPPVLTCPNEMVGLSAAHGYAQVTGRAQAVVVHVECGTQALAGAVHNAAKGRIPVLIYAGASPYTQEGELLGSRNEFIQWIQDVADQRGLVRGYMKYDNEIRTGRNVKQLVRRAMQFAHSDPPGPVYLMGGREAMEEEIPPVQLPSPRSETVSPGALSAEGLDILVADLLAARRPLVVTSYVGRRPAAVAELERLCQRLGMGVLESVPNYMNFPHDHPLYLGNQWNLAQQNQALAQADLVLVLDSDVPWIPQVNRPDPTAVIHHIDVDPLKTAMPLWYIEAKGVFRADAATALAQINARLDQMTIDQAALVERRAHYGDLHAQRAARLEVEARPSPDGITPHYLAARLALQLGSDGLVLNEGITNYNVLFDHLARTQPGSIFTSGGGSLGWNGGAAIGMKLAAPDKDVVAISGDGSYLFSVPASVHWMARRYRTPFVQIVLNNGGWRAPRHSALGVHPDGYASATEDLDISFDPAPDYAGVAAAAGGAHARIVKTVEELDEAIAEALRVTREEGRCAVLDVWLARS
ncbi:thiamine pyrophosphate-requiring protein [Caulobacter soli]|uniref:thiamine pyrophosphate-requiring protein n=1 Tax=Caulobacter soli TaxID=2708539 RepID=UPI0013EB78FA|nr:thiamine pyrophosphate-requiring protein [Caulobacter soli]